MSVRFLLPVLLFCLTGCTDTRLSEAQRLQMATPMGMAQTHCMAVNKTTADQQSCLARVQVFSDTHPDAANAVAPAPAPPANPTGCPMIGDLPVCSGF